MKYFKNSKITNNEKGITLIVLIVTIVVLLVLAGVTVAHITGGDGIIEQASNKKDEATIANEKQILSNAVIAATNESKLGEITENNLREALSNKNVDIVKSGGLYRITFKDTNNLYKMNQDGEFFAWEDMEPTDIYAKKDGTTLYLRSTQPNTSYIKGTKWNDNTITKVVIEEPIAPLTCYNMFRNCSQLQEIENIENFHTENVKNMCYMFYNCQNLLSLDISKFVTENVTGGTNQGMFGMFEGCTNLKNLNFSSFNTSKVKSLNRMFRSCSNLTYLNLSNFDTSNVEDMGRLFEGCTQLTNININTFDTSKTKNMENMFSGCSNLKTLDINNFNTNNVSNMQSMFNGCKEFIKLDLSSFNTNLVTNMSYMFQNCKNLKTIYISNLFNIDNVSSSNNMFLSCFNLTGENETKYDPEYVSKTYARIDDPEHDKPGYFTLKTTE